MEKRVNLLGKNGKEGKTMSRMSVEKYLECYKKNFFKGEVCGECRFWENCDELNKSDEEVCSVHGCPLKDFVSATEEGTEYFPFCPKCADEEAKYWEEQSNRSLGVGKNE